MSVELFSPAFYRNLIRAAQAFTLTSEVVADV